MISIGTEGIFLRLVPHGVVLTFSFDDKEETRVLTLRRRAFPSQRFYSSYTLTTLMWWSNVTCKTSKLLCLFLDKDVMSFRINISYSRKGAFLHVHIFSYNTAVGWELRRRIQRLDQFYNITWLWGDLFICNQARFATHGKIKFLSADVESVAETTSMLLLKVWEQRFSLNDSMNKTAADVRRRCLVFDVGDLVWAYFTRDRMPAHTYIKLKSIKVGPLEVLERINDNAYRLKLPADINTSDVFNVKHLSRYVPANTGSDSGSNPSNPASLSLAPT